jgi:diguanylate cyclase (GGDEF)-like protein
LVILSNCDRDAAFALAEKVRIQVEQATAEGLGAIKITVSVGVTEMVEIDTENSLLSRVDEALYEAKRSGRNRAILA